MANQKSEHLMDTNHVHWCLPQTYVPQDDAQKLTKYPHVLSEFNKLQVIIVEKFEQMRCEVLEKSLKMIKDATHPSQIDEIQTNLQKELRVLRHHIMELESQKFYECLASAETASTTIQDAVNQFSRMQENQMNSLVQNLTRDNGNELNSHACAEDIDTHNN